MIKRINIEQLKPGMYIHDINCGWMGHPFLFNAFKVNTAQDIDKISAYGIREFYIDTSRGMDVQDAQTEEEISAEIHEQVTQVVKNQDKKIVAPALLKEEIVAARIVHHQANGVVHNILSDIRLGKQIEVEQLKPVVENITDSIFRNQDALLALSRIKQKDDYTFQHSVSVCALLVAFCRAMGYERDVILDVGMGGLLHDVGKMKVPDYILNKPGELTEDEFNTMQSHAALGRDILRQTEGVTDIAAMIAGQHHERFDGTGYPDKLKGGEISQFGQLASIVDVYDALTSNRIYHTGLAPFMALKKLYEWSKFHFDEPLVQHFIRAIGIYPTGTLVRLESGLIGVVIKPGTDNLLHPVVRAMYDVQRETHISPRDIDLSLPASQGGGDRIVAHELPEKWGIDPYAFLPGATIDIH